MSRARPPPWTFAVMKKSAASPHRSRRRDVIGEPCPQLTNGVPNVTQPVEGARTSLFRLRIALGYQRAQGWIAECCRRERPTTVKEQKSFQTPKQGDIHSHSNRPMRKENVSMAVVRSGGSKQHKVRQSPRFQGSARRLIGVRGKAQGCMGSVLAPPRVRPALL